MNIGSDVPEVTWIALRWVFRLGMARPSPMPAPIARMIHTGRKRSRNDNRAMTGAFGDTPNTGRSDTMSLTARPHLLLRCGVRRDAPWLAQWRTTWSRTQQRH